MRYLDLPARCVLRLICVGLAAAVVGCASSHVLVGTARPPISPDQVRLYTQLPAQYEEIAIVQASSQGSFVFGDQRKTNKVIQRLRGEAAKLGANGLVLQEIGIQYAGSVGTGFGSATESRNSAFGSSVGISTGLTARSGKGTAIYVPPQ
jgi:hypothetical protein